MNIKQIIKEYIDSKQPVKVYAFDWDDNIMFMPTKIIAISDKGVEVGVGTEDFAHHRDKLNKKEPFEYEGHILVGYATNPFRNFRPEGDVQFLKDVMSAELATNRSWNDFVEAINSGAIFSIITARGHKPSTLRQAVKQLILKEIGGIDRRSCERNFKRLVKMKPNLKSVLSSTSTIDAYLNACKFYPVSYLYASAASPEQAKTMSLDHFLNYVHKFFDKIKLVNDLRNKFIPPFKFGFSDDDKKNAEVMKQHVAGKYKKKPQKYNVYLTKDDEKATLEEQKERFSKAALDRLIKRLKIQTETEDGKIDPKFKKFLKTATGKIYMPAMEKEDLSKIYSLLKKYEKMDTGLVAEKFNLIKTKKED